MKANSTKDLIKTRRFICRANLKGSSIEEVEKVGINLQEILAKYGSLSNLVEQLLEQERISFEEIFIENDFKGMNAIDRLLIVSQEVNRKFHYLSPMTTIGLKEQFPIIYEKHIAKRLAFTYKKFKNNINKGISQKVYKQDLSAEMLARIYVSKLNEMHDSKIYPSSKLTFSTIFSKLIKDFIYTNATKDGIAYYKQRKQLYNVLNFGH